MKRLLIFLAYSFLAALFLGYIFLNFPWDQYGQGIRSKLNPIDQTNVLVGQKKDSLGNKYAYDSVDFHSNRLLAGFYKNKRLVEICIYNIQNKRDSVIINLDN